MCTTCGCKTVDDGHEHAGADEHRNARPDLHEHAHTHDEERARTVRIERDLLAKNSERASANRRAVARARIAMFNLIGAPGAGKTALLEALIRRFRGEASVAVLEGDQATDRDAKRIERVGCRVVQINTGTGCHLDASMVEHGLAALAPPPGSIVFIENVGNLVCPALFDLGEHAKIVVVSATEGEDKPLKYPHVFRASRLMVLTKIDLLSHLTFDEAECMAFARRAAGPRLEIVRASTVAGEGIDELARWIQREAARVARGESVGVHP